MTDLIKWHEELNENTPSAKITQLDSFADPQGRHWVADESGVYRMDGNFYEGRPFSVTNSGQEVASYELFLIIEKGEGALLNISREINGKIEFLLQFKPQVGVNQLTTTIQASKGNLTQNNVLFSDIVDNESIFTRDSKEIQVATVPDPGKFYKKTNYLMDRRLIDSSYDVLQHIPEDQKNRFRWTSLEELVRFREKTIMDYPEAVSEFIRLWAFDYLLPSLFKNV